jgi:cell division protein ZapA (FtsZ GTPase activity inhibitor)
MNVQITIRGRQYTVRSDEPEEDIEAVARFVDEKMSEISRRSFDEYTVALLTALNIASEYYRFRRIIADRLDGLDREAAAISAVLDAALPGGDVE